MCTEMHAYTYPRGTMAVRIESMYQNQERSHTCFERKQQKKKLWSQGEINNEYYQCSTGKCPKCTCKYIDRIRDPIKNGGDTDDWECWREGGRFEMTCCYLILYINTVVFVYLKDKINNLLNKVSATLNDCVIKLNTASLHFVSISSCSISLSLINFNAASYHLFLFTLNPLIKFKRASLSVVSFLCLSSQPFIKVLVGLLFLLRCKG